MLRYRLGTRAARAMPWRLGEAFFRTLGKSFGRFDRKRRRLAARHILRVGGSGLNKSEVESTVDGMFASYASYWFQSFRLTGMQPHEIAAGFSTEGFENVVEAHEDGKGVILAMPHLGGWDWAGCWLGGVARYPVAAVVEVLEPSGVFEWFRDYRRSYGIEVIPLDSEAGVAVNQALSGGSIVVLLSDRHVGGAGVDVEFFGEVTTLPAGPAALALRTGAALIPAASYIRGRGCHAVAQKPLVVAREDSFRRDVLRVTQLLAVELEKLIRAAPEQWHLFQPNWPSDEVPSLLEARDGLLAD